MPSSPILPSAALAAVLCCSVLSAQVRWTPATPGATPGPRSDIAMVFDPLRGTVLLSGGWNGTRDLDDTWEWDGVTWRRLSPATSPGPHSSHRLVCDTARNRIVTFGGWNGGALRGGTWEWNGSDWAQRTSATTPPPRASYAMAYDAGRARTVLFGGFCGNNCALGDTWEWDGTNWTQRTPATSPVPRYSAGMTYDAARGVVLLFGGRASSGRLNDTWTWDGNTWTRLSPSNAPSQRSTPVMGYDALRERAVLFGGFDNTTRGDTWEWDGATWQQRTVSPSPAGRTFAALAFDAARQQSVLYGGDSFGAIRSDTWTYQTASVATYAPFGTGCAGTGGTPELGAAGRRPWTGEGFTLHLDRLPPAAPFAFVAVGGSTTAWGPLPLPFDLTPLGAPNCVVLAALESSIGVVPVAGAASWSVSVPEVASLIGASFHCQGGAPDTVNALGVVLTGAGSGVIGAK